MTVNGRSTDLLHELTHAPKADGHRFFPQMDVMFHGMFQGLISSLDLASRGYLCAQLVDCDSTTDPECGPAGKKLLIPEQKSGAAGMDAGAESSVRGPLHEDLSRN